MGLDAASPGSFWRSAAGTRKTRARGVSERTGRNEAMHFVLFTHSLVSDWNHGNAHFQRGILWELIARGHSCRAWEPADGWSRTSLLAEQGRGAVERFEADFPELAVGLYGPLPDLDPLLEGADVVLVHEWTDPQLVAALGRKRRMGGRFTLLFHDTHHRGVSAAKEIDSSAARSPSPQLPIQTRSSFCPFSGSGWKSRTS